MRCALLGRITPDLLTSPASVTKQRRQLGSHFLHCFVCAMPKALCLARFPVDAFQVVHKDNAGYTRTGGNGHFEWVSLGLVCDRACQQQPGPHVI